MNNLKPFEIVNSLDKYIVGQRNAKRSVAIALRNRWRRQHVIGDLKEEIPPKNIILIGPTGVGKTEISRRLSKLSDSPFSKVDASKFTEVGYVGRDVESMVRDLLTVSIGKVKALEQKKVRDKAIILAEERMLNLLLPESNLNNTSLPASNEKKLFSNTAESEEVSSSTREKFRKMLKSGKLDNRYVEVNFAERNLPTVEIFSGMGMDDIGSSIKDMLGSFMPKNSKSRKMRVSEAMESITQEEAQNLVDMDKVIRLSIEKVEQMGIIFIDEIDKVVSTSRGNSPDISREGVQRDLLPLVEGTIVTTKYGPVRTDNILFIASGAFHTVKPSDLIPELQGRFPIRVELDALKKNDFYRILTEPKNALLLQYVALLKTEGVDLIFEDEAVKKIAELAEHFNATTENIGARRLHTLMERILEDILFDAPEVSIKELNINKSYVEDKLSTIKDNEDLSRYIL